MALNSLAVATQGLGYSALLIAVQGLMPLDDEATTQQPFGRNYPRRRVRRIYPPPAAALPPDEDDDEAIALWVLRR